MVKAAVNSKVNFNTLYLLSEMVAGSHIKLYQVCGGLAIRAESFVFPFIFPLKKSPHSSEFWKFQIQGPNNQFGVALVKDRFYRLDGFHWRPVRDHLSPWSKRLASVLWCALPTGFQAFPLLEACSYFSPETPTFWPETRAKF